MCRMIDAFLFLRGTWQSKSDKKVTVKTAEQGDTGVDRGGAYAQNRWNEKGGGAGGSGRQKWRERNRTRDASLQMRGLEARRQFKQALAPSQAWQTAHSPSPLFFTLFHTPTHKHTCTRKYMHAHKSVMHVGIHSCSKKRKKINKKRKLLNRQGAQVCRQSRVSNVQIYAKAQDLGKCQLHSYKTFKSPADMPAGGA